LATQLCYVADCDSLRVTVVKLRNNARGIT